MCGRYYRKSDNRRIAEAFHASKVFYEWKRVGGKMAPSPQ